MGLNVKLPDVLREELRTTVLCDGASAFVEHLLERGEARVRAHEPVMEEFVGSPVMGAVELLEVPSKGVESICEVCRHRRTLLRIRAVVQIGAQLYGLPI